MSRPEIAGVTWRKSSRSGPNGNCVEVAAVAEWRTSSRSNGAGNCVEVTSLDPVVAVRDSKDPSGDYLAATSRCWERFATALKQSRLQ